MELLEEARTNFVHRRRHADGKKTHSCVTSQSEAPPVALAMGNDNDKFVGPKCKFELTMRAFLLLLVATAGLVWFGRIDVINHAETVVISGSARLRGLQHYAVGVNTGGPNAPTAVDALWKGHLRFFTNIIIMGDVADAKRQIRTPPKRYYCTHNSAFGPSLDDKLVWKSHGRCTQLRFLYLVLTLREEFPDATYYLLLDDDAWIDPRGLSNLLSDYDTTRPWLMGPPHPYNTPEFQVGGMLVMSRRLVQLFDPKTLMQCASHWEFAADFGPKCQDGLECYRKTLPQFTWCTELLTNKCGGLKHAPDFQKCAKQLAAQETQCGFEHAASTRCRCSGTASPTASRCSSAATTLPLVLRDDPHRGPREPHHAAVLPFREAVPQRPITRKPRPEHVARAAGQLQHEPARGLPLRPPAPASQVHARATAWLALVETRGTLEDPGRHLARIQF